MKDDDVKAMNAVASPDFDALLRDLFLHSREIPGDRVDAEIRNVQRLVCEWLDLDRCTLWQTPPGDPGAPSRTCTRRRSSRI